MGQENKKLMKRIDLSQINKGETIYQGYVYDTDGTKLRPVPYIEKTEEEIKEEKGPSLQELEKKLNEIEKDTEAREKIADRFAPIPLSALMSKEYKESEWLVDKLIPLEGTTALSGSPASFKTWLTLDMAIKVSMGEALFGKFPTKKTGVLIIDEENGERLLTSRLKKMCQVKDLPIYFNCLKGFKLGRAMTSEIIKISEKHSIGLIIFDSLVRIHNANENDAVEMAEVFGHFKELNKHGLTVLVTHHNRKKGIFKEDPAQSLRGSSDISASVECHLALDRKRSENSITVIQAKNRLAEEAKPFSLTVISDEENFRFEYSEEVDEKGIKKEDEQNLFLEALKNLGQTSLLEIYQTLKGEIGMNKIREIAKELKEKGEILSKKEAHNKEMFFLNEPGAPEFFDQTENNT